MSSLVFILAHAVAPLGETQVHGDEPARAATQKYIDAETAQRLYRITKPLLAAMDHSLGPGQVSIGIVADDAINAANGGGGKPGALIETLSWLAKNSARAGGFVATHSHIGDRIKTLKAMPR